MLVLALAFSLLFTPKTMRLDYFHTGDHGREIVAADRIVSDGPWAGSTTRLLDDLNLGTYFFEVVDPGTNQALYSRSFASLYGEWETTPEAKTTARTFHESLRFPWPKAPVHVVLKKRGADGLFREIWTTRDEVGFCKVCRRAIERVIDLYASPATGGSSKALGI
jgi:hypothetical protein